MSTIILRSCVRAQLLALLVVLAYSPSRGQEVECPPGCGPGRWSNEAVDLSSARSKAPYQTRDIRVASPDRQKIARIVKDIWWIETDGAKIVLGPNASQILYPAELAWAPDSRALYITEGSGYSTGYRVHIYRLEDHKLHCVTDLNQSLQHDFERRHKCSDGQSPNIAGLHWMDDSQQLLIVSEVPPVGICVDMEYFGGYLIAVDSGKIVKRYSPEALKDRWEDVLGYRLKGDFAELSAERRVALP